MSIIETMIDIPMEHERNVCGQFDAYLKKIERTLHVTMITRDGALKIIGPEQTIRQAKSVFNNLLELSRRGNTVTEQNVDYALSLSFTEKDDQILEIDKDIICRTITGKPVKPKTMGQKQYVDLIRKKMIVFGIGPAGTGKTYLAMSMAIQAFKSGEVSRIILTRPAIEAGEKLGFLPGDLQSKIDPYLRPLYDALYQIMGAESFIKNQEKGLIEVAPLAYMRGRTLDNAFIIHRVNNDFIRLSKQMFGWRDDAEIYTASNVIEIAKDRDGGIQDYFIPLYYEVESKRLKNSFTENKIYGWDNNGDGFSDAGQFSIPFD